MNEVTFKPIEEQPKTNDQINLPNLKEPNKQNQELIVELPDWNIEPPVEINRGQNDIR